MADRYSLKDTFDHLDKTKTGFIDLNDLKSALISCDRRVSIKDVRKSVEKRGLDPDNLMMDYGAFTDFMGDYPTLTVSDLHKYFDALDLDGSGYLTAAEIRHVMTNMNMKSDDGVMDEMIAMYDLNGTGQLLVGEFCELIKGLGFVVVDDSDDEAELEAVADTSSPEEKKEEPQEEDPVTCKIDEFPEPLRDIVKMFDFDGNGTVNATDLQRAAELLKVEKMAGAKDPESNPSLHWKKGRDKRGLGEVIYKANHIALIVEDVGRSAAFYSDVLGFQQIRRPNFDRHGAWFTMGNLELHLIKGTPLVHSGEDLIVGHISIETFGIDKVPKMLRKMGVPFRQNVSVPKGPDAGGKGTNASNTSDMIVRQYFIRDPDGYYIEVCNCDVLTKYCLGEKINLDSYEEGARPISIKDAGKLIAIMQRWTTAGAIEKENREGLVEEAKKTDMSFPALADLFGCVPAESVDKELLASMITRKSVYGDICQDATEKELEEVLIASGNDVTMATKILKLKANVMETRYLQPPTFYEEGTDAFVPKKQNLDDDV